MELNLPETGQKIEVTIEVRIKTICPECGQTTDQQVVEDEKGLSYQVCKVRNTVK